MKLVSFIKNGEPNIGLFIKGNVLPLKDAAATLNEKFPSTMKEFLEDTETYDPIARNIEALAKKGKFQELMLPFNKLYETGQIQACVPNPTSLRDAYSFKQHVETARKSRGLDVPKEFYQFPVFYYSNHNAVIGPGSVFVQPDHLVKLDYELEVAVVIGKKGINIPAEKADEYIYGYTIMNDFSARQLQAEEMKLGLGPAKGKDFATALSPFLITKDELKPMLLPPKEGHVGERYNLVMKAYVNGRLFSIGNTAEMDWSFAEIIERISYGTPILPGDVIGSGTVGSGCLLEINLVKAKDDPDYEPIWLKNGDTVKLEIDMLGFLENKIVVKDAPYSLFEKKKNI